MPGSVVRVWPAGAAPVREVTLSSQVVVRCAGAGASGALRADPVQGPLQVLGVGAGELHPAPVAGVLEAEPDGVQPLPGQTQPLGERGVGAVGQVADAGVAVGGHVHADLVGAAGLQLDVEQAGGAERLDEVVVGDARACRRR